MRKVPLIFILIILLTSLNYAKTSSSSINWLSLGLADQLYPRFPVVCLANGTNCNFNTTYFNASTSGIVAGTVSGYLNQTRHPLGNYDGITINITEVAANPGLEIYINFTNITQFNGGLVRYKTSSGLLGDAPIIQLWDYIDSEWEDYPTLSETSSFDTLSRVVYDWSSHIQNGIVQMRLIKEAQGNVNNDYYIDWLSIWKGVSVTPISTETDPVWNSYKVNIYNITQVNDKFVNTTGDTMTGNLTIGYSKLEKDITLLIKTNTTNNPSIALIEGQGMAFGFLLKYNSNINSLELNRRRNNTETNVMMVNRDNSKINFSANISLSADSRINLLADSIEVPATDGSLLNFYAIQGDSRPFITWYDYKNHNQIIGYFGCHYNTTGGDVHEHCSIETSADDGTIKSKFIIPYNKSYDDSTVEIANVKKLLLTSGVELWSSSGWHDSSTFELYPGNQSAYYLIIGNNTDGVYLQGGGTGTKGLQINNKLISNSFLKVLDTSEFIKNITVGNSSTGFDKSIVIKTDTSNDPSLYLIEGSGLSYGMKMYYDSSANKFYMGMQSNDAFKSSFSLARDTGTMDILKDLTVNSQVNAYSIEVNNTPVCTSSNGLCNQTTGTFVTNQTNVNFTEVRVDNIPISSNGTWIWFGNINISSSQFRIRVS